MSTTPHWRLLMLVAFAVLENCDGQIFLDITDGWTVVNSNQTFNVPATVPGTVYTDLIKAEILGDPYYRFNDVDYRWVAYDNWTYTTTVQVTSDILAKNHVFLVSDGLDTSATVSINGIDLAVTNNMFVRYRWPAKDLLVLGANEIQVAFQSPVYYGIQQHESHLATYGYQVPPACTAAVQNGECHVNMIRKIQSSFSWDWGPAFPTMGIWKPIRLEAVDTCVIRDVLVNTVNGGGSLWFLTIVAYLDCSDVASQSGNLTISLGDEPNQWKLTTPVTLTPDSDGVASANYTSQVPESLDVQTWWPNGHGSQPLYNLSVSYTPSADVETPTSKSVRIGFRTIELIQDPVSNETGSGLTFYFKINGVPIFMKGSNWIPADSFPERIEPSYLRNLLQSAKDANMNALRVWGGGMYEQDALYELTDELGLFIWQDMMFACAMYPTDPDYISAVQSEVTQQVRRLQHHPSILIWSGNNENEAALADNWYNTDKDYDLYTSDYVKLYVDTINTIVAAEDTSRPYVTSSPSNGDETISEGYVAQSPGDPLYGDVHYYNYASDGWDWKIYPRTRFTSEYGFQSWPSFETLAKVSIEEDWDYNSEFMEHRQHHSLGNLEMATGFTRHMNLPKGCTVPTTRGHQISHHQYSISAERNLKMCDSVDGFKGMLYLTQVYQAMSIKTETESYRRARSELQNNKGYTMGALYWQLDDIWQGASWASLEYGGKWKVLHYYAVNFFANFLVSPYVDQDGDTLAIYAVNDNDESYVNSTYEIAVHSWSQFQPYFTIGGNGNVKPSQTTRIFEGSVSNLLTDAGCSPEECFFVVDLQSGTGLTSRNFMFFVPFYQAVGIVKSNITASAQATADSSVFTITLTTDHVAPFMWLEAEGISGRFSDNGFLLHTQTRNVDFIAWQDVTVEQLTQNLTVMSLMDLY